MPEIPRTQSRLEDKAIDRICADMCRFIQRGMCHEDGEFYNHEGVLAADECRALRTCSTSLI